MKTISLICICIFFFSCGKNIDENPESNGSYFPLQIGNYWVYQHYSIDTSGNEEATGIVDSIYVRKDSLINDIRYFVLEGTNYPNQRNEGILDILRDSSGYIINNKGNIYFSSSNFSDILASGLEVRDSDTLYQVNYQMESEAELINVPAGSFEALNYRGTVKIGDVFNSEQTERYLDNFYAKGVGKILERYFYVNSPELYEKRLIKFNVE